MLARPIYIFAFLLLAFGVAACHHVAAQQHEQKTFIVGNPLLVSY